MQIITNSLELEWTSDRTRNGGDHEPLNGMERVERITGELVFRLAPGESLSNRQVESAILNSPQIGEMFHCDSLTGETFKDQGFLSSSVIFGNENRAIVSRMEWAVVKVRTIFSHEAPDYIAAYDLHVQILSFADEDSPEREIEGED